MIGVKVSAKNIKWLTKKYKPLKKSATMLDVKIIMALQLLFGQYFKISSSKIISLFQRFYCICTSLLTVYNVSVFTHYYAMDDTLLVFFNSIVLFEFILWSITSQITSNAQVSVYTRTVFTYDALLSFSKKLTDLKYVLIVLILNSCLTVASFIFYLLTHWAVFISETDKLFTLISYHFARYSLELVNVRITLVVGLLHDRLASLRRILEKNLIPVNIIGKDEIQSKLRVVRKSMLYYNHLIDAFDNIDSYLQFTATFNLYLSIPKIVIFGYYFMRHTIYNKLPWTKQHFVELSVLLLQIYAPCAICELCLDEIDTLKTVLTMQVIRCSDACLRTELQRTLDFVSRRNFNFTLLRAMRVDIHLAVGISALCFTYVIILVQFTHFKV